MKNWRNILGLVLPLLVVVLLVLWPIFSGKAVDQETSFTILKAVALASSLNIILGYTGYVSFGHIVFFGVGGYTGFYLMSQMGWSLWMAMFAGAVMSGVIAFLLGKAILRLRGAYFALATIGVNQAMLALVGNLDFIGGPIGMNLNFKVYKEYGGAQEALQMAFYIMAGIALISVIVSHAVRTSKFGLSLLAIREDEDAAEVMGVVAPNIKTWAYVISAVIPGIVGALFFFKNGSIEPHDAFPLHTSIEFIVMVMLGGQGTVLGPVLGAIGYQGIRGYLLTSPIFKNIQLAVAGVLLLLIVLFIPYGVVGWIRNRYPKTRRVLQ
ncbi:MAG TPA: branched-chain amino acid ABC transporter permease [Anaerolineales bacterium]|nr:branched-chain amino acid ABC transporter permease [Anaerolineales bacterium]